MSEEVKMRKVNRNTVNEIMEHIYDTRRGTEFPSYFIADRKALKQILGKYLETTGKEYSIVIVERGNQPQNAKLVNMGFFHVLYEDRNQAVLYMIT